jgi:uncharacterized membrane protein YphA (DoxX/SURF4 family)
MQPLFSTFPSGRPGAALLLLRGAVGATLLVVGGTHLGDWDRGGGLNLAAGLLATASGAALLIGFLTAFAAVGALVGVVLAILGPPAQTSILLNGKLAAVLTVIVVAAIALLGPGGFSLDARLFGRREIKIPRARSGSPDD